MIKGKPVSTRETTYELCHKDYIEAVILHLRQKGYTVPNYDDAHWELHDRRGFGGGDVIHVSWKEPME